MLNNFEIFSEIVESVRFAGERRDMKCWIEHVETMQYICNQGGFIRRLNEKQTGKNPTLITEVEVGKTIFVYASTKSITLFQPTNVSVLS